MLSVTLSAILARGAGAKNKTFQPLLEEYTTRLSRYAATETHLSDTEPAFFEWLDKQSARTPVYLVLMDSRGKQLSSEEIAETIGHVRDAGTQRIVFAIGPADGWSATARSRASLMLSFGRITLPHQLARVVVAEQVYRAFTILAGHPYHSGH
ncbi:MAG: 23S rRNA (pseudouridine(1915)-N(3))-methyltransferase RlmH [Edaphobacter sp.]|uniref:23S rRNA (pseudouridine(1915)-N(3))-methyltransferase RlmH n=1 Tax=Edaphobacter sp. TaxID=1934404 RepID=UPI00238DD568|nr:23S rRNA (pseudouridine(1915)-N(3))-methyltransferase RlmH [Edaphobacter sp.]MDE1176769.1 23S rRNA (pseudouridine(1915)-N(3))-methyltransferase RlmH [Edaphobacter sp.]